MKNIKELTEADGKEILEFVYPGKTDLSNPKKYDYWFTGFSFEPVVDKEGRQQLTFGLRSIIGIKYHDDQDNCLIHFDNTKVVLWLYKNGYDILELLEDNKHHSEMENDWQDVMDLVYKFSKGIDGFHEEYKQNWTTDYVQKECLKMVEKMFDKEYK